MGLREGVKVMKDLTVFNAGEPVLRDAHIVDSSLSDCGDIAFMSMTLALVEPFKSSRYRKICGFERVREVVALPCAIKRYLVVPPFRGRWRRKLQVSIDQKY